MELSLEYGQQYYFRLHGLFGGVLALAAAGALMESCLESGEQAKLMELLRRCTGQSCQEYRIDAVKEGKKRKRK